MSTERRPNPVGATAAPLAQRGERFTAVVALMDRLLAPDGCPWDREQTLHTLRPYLIEEAYELLEAMEGGDLSEHREELGDVLFQVVFQAALRAREGGFGIDDVCQALVSKMEGRHPHVFGDLRLADADAVVDNWARVKEEEHQRKGTRRGALDGVPRSLPALSRAGKLGERAARVGFDWPDVAGVRDKLNEELAELDAAMAQAAAQGDPADQPDPGTTADPDQARSRIHDEIRHEIGDVLFTLTRLAAKLGVDPEDALRGACGRFEQRFRRVEERVIAQGKQMGETNLAELDGYWQQVKRELAEGLVPKK